ncbi:type II secretion system F family protein [Streptosporangium soli]|nr:type II secretion system F family protein [Streptosporangium sp. KLBMP 9127]
MLVHRRAAFSWSEPDRVFARRFTTFLRSRRDRGPEQWRTASVELCHGLSAELAAGRTPAEALTRAAREVDFPDPPAMRAVLGAARDGGDVSAAMIAAAPERGGDGLRRLAACWQVSIRTGAALSVLVDRVGGTLRAAESHRHEVAAQLAGPRASARLLAALPLLGLLLAAALGMRPLHFLFGSPAGLACLLLGVSLDVCGLWWTNRLMTRAQET